MIGIYKITNKTNGKSYVGQSIHCGKRLDEHCKGSQLIDEIIQIEGIENFTFEILKEVNREDLSYWEDYYIIKYDTMFPNGYNKRWNCNKEIRKFIEQEVNNEINNSKIEKFNLKDNRVLFPIDDMSLKRIGYSDYVYAWLILHSCNVENKNYTLIYKKDFTFTQIAQDTHRHRDTISKRFKDLIKEKLILETEYNQKKAYKILYSNDYIELNKNIVLKLLSLPPEKQQEELVKTYAYLLKKNQLKENENNLDISANEVILAFGHSNGNSQIFNRFNLILNTLKELNT